MYVCVCVCVCVCVVGGGTRPVDWSGENCSFALTNCLIFTNIQILKLVVYCWLLGLWVKMYPICVMKC